EDPERSAGYLRQVLFLDPENVEAKLQLKGVSPVGFDVSKGHPELDDAFSAHDRDTTPPPPAEAAQAFQTTPPERGTTPPPAFDTTPPEAAAHIETSREFEPEGRVSFGDLEVDVELLEPISPDEFEALPLDDSQAEPVVAEHAD